MIDRNDWPPMSKPIPRGPNPPPNPNGIHNKFVYNVARRDGTQAAVISEIQLFAHEHSLSAQQVRDIFSAGIVSQVRAGLLDVKRYLDGELPGCETSIVLNYTIRVDSPKGVAQVKRVDKGLKKIRRKVSRRNEQARN